MTTVFPPRAPSPPSASQASPLSAAFAHPATSGWLFGPSFSPAALPRSLFSLALALRSTVQVAAQPAVQTTLLVPAQLSNGLLFGLSYIFENDDTDERPSAQGRFAFDVKSKQLFLLALSADGAANVASLVTVSAKGGCLRLCAGLVSLCDVPSEATAAPVAGTAFRLSAFPGRRNRSAPKDVHVESELPLSDVSEDVNDGEGDAGAQQPRRRSNQVLRRKRAAHVKVEEPQNVGTDVAAMRDALDVVEKALTGRFVCSAGDRGMRVGAMVIAAEEQVEQRLRRCAADVYYAGVFGEEGMLDC